MKKRVSKKRSASRGFPFSNPYASLESRSLLATIAVTTPLDVIDASDGLTSLREAIIESNSNGEDDLIVLGSETYQLSIPGISEDDSLTGDLDIKPDSFNRLTVRGAGMDATTIDGGNLDRVFEMFEDSHVNFEDVHITAGSDAQQPNEIGRRGGGISNLAGNLFLDRVRMTDNDTGTFGAGGAIYAAGGRLEIVDSILTGNFSDSAGSAIFLRNMESSIRGSVIKNNIANQTFFGYSSSSIESRQSALLIEETSIEENTRGLNTIGGALDVSESRFLRHGTPSSGANGFFMRDYGIKSDGTEVTVDSVNFVANEKGIEFAGVENDLVINNALFHGNYLATMFDGKDISISDSIYRRQTDGVSAVLVYSDFIPNAPDRTVTVDNSVFEFNGSMGLRGGFATFNITDSRFERNESHGLDVSGDLFVRDSQFVDQLPWAHGIKQNGERTQIVNSQFTGNGNSAINIDQSGKVLISHSEISNNTGRGSGGGVRISPFYPDSEILISNSAISENRVLPAFNSDGSQYAEGGAIGVRNPIASSNYRLIVSSSTVAKNWAMTRGGILSTNSIDNAGDSVEFRNSIFWGNRSPQFRMITPEFSAVAFHSAFQDFAGGDGNVPFGGIANGNTDRYPKFLNWGGGDYRLTGSSPAVDSGDNGLLDRDIADVDNDGNVIEFAPDLQYRSRLLGGTTDMGAFEFRA